MFKEFYKFLEDNDALEKFKDNYGELEDYEDYIGDEPPIFYLTFAFQWRLSNEGKVYWHELNEKWEAITKGNKDG